MGFLESTKHDLPFAVKHLKEHTFEIDFICFQHLRSKKNSPFTRKQIKEPDWSRESVMAAPSENFPHEIFYIEKCTLKLVA